MAVALAHDKIGSDVNEIKKRAINIAAQVKID
jgi:hypothetical protein